MTEQKWTSLAFTGYLNYSISSDGQVRNDETKRPLKITPSPLNGYCSIALCKGGLKRNFKVHSLVLTAFMGPAPQKGMTCHHINRIRDDNRLENLEWATGSEQTANSYHPPVKKMKPVEQLDLQMNHVNVWPSQSEIVRQYGFSKLCLWKAIKMGTPYNGYHWRLYFEPIPGEIWAPIPIPEFSHMLASSHGRIYRKGTATYGTFKSGYMEVATTLPGGKTFSRKVHTLVASAFYGIHEGLEVNHKDGKKRNNHKDNLQFETHGDNVKHAHDTGLIKTKKAVAQLDLDGNLIRSFNSIQEAADAHKIVRSGISAVINGRGKTAAGFKWALFDKLPSPSVH